MGCRRLPSCPSAPVCSRPLSACEPVHPSSGGPQWPSLRARTVPAALRARPPLAWRPSTAISAGSHRTSRPASPSAPSSGGPQRPSPRARTAPAALRARPALVWRPSAAISAGSPVPAALRARPPLVWRPSAAISAGSRRAIPPCHSAVPFHRPIPPCHSICETINAKVFCSPEAIKRIMCIYKVYFCSSDVSTKRYA